METARGDLASIREQGKLTDAAPVPYVMRRQAGGKRLSAYKPAPHTGARLRREAGWSAGRFAIRRSQLDPQQEAANYVNVTCY